MTEQGYRKNSDLEDAEGEQVQRTINKNDQEMQFEDVHFEDTRVDSVDIETVRIEDVKMEEPTGAGESMGLGEAEVGEELRESVRSEEELKGAVQGVSEPEATRVEYRFIPETKKGPSAFKIFFGLILVIALGFSVGFGYRFASHFYSERIIEVKTAQVPEGSKVGIDTDATSTRITEIAEKYSPAIVSVVGEQRSYYGASKRVIGTGVVFSQDKDKLYILSNEHVIKYGSDFSYDDLPVYISFGGDRLYTAQVLGSDTLADLAVVSVDKKDIPQDYLKKLVPVTFADSTKVKVGEWVVAMGNPLGYIDTTTFGIVSGRERRVGESGLDVELIQLDAAINSGNSGGATFNIKGEVIGINTIKIKETGVEGLAFAIASNDVKNVISQIMEKGRVERVFLGIQGRSIEDMVESQFEAPEDEAKGVFIETTFQGTSAEKAGLRQGDIIHKIDDVEIETMAQLSSLIKSKKVGDKIVLTIRRGDEMDKKIEVVLGIRPDFK